MSLSDQFTQPQIKVIEAILDTFFANLTPIEKKQIAEYHATFAPLTDAQQQHLNQFLSLNGSDLKASEEFMYLTLAVPQDKQFLLKLVLKLLASPIGTKLICGGSLRPWVPFYELSRDQREKAF
jgi:hypothetical protein